MFSPFPFGECAAGGRKSDSVSKWEAGLVQEAGCTLGTRTGEGECYTLQLQLGKVEKSQLSHLQCFYRFYVLYFCVCKNNS